MPLPVLVVCTGNVCRSPAAAAMLRTWTAPPAELAVASAGLAALVDAPIDPPVATALRDLRVTADEHRARQYEQWMALDAGLVLTATGTQSRQILRDVPQAWRRVFTIKEFARLASQRDGGPGLDAQVVAEVAAMRGQVPAVPYGADDVDDPYRRPQADVDAAVADIATAVRTALDSLGLLEPRRPMPYRR